MKRKSRVPCEHKHHIICHLARTHLQHINDTHTAIKDARAIVNFVLDKIIEAIKTHGMMELRGFGTFKIVKRKARIARNPRTNEPMPLPSRLAVKFKPGENFRAALRDPKTKCVSK